MVAKLVLFGIATSDLGTSSPFISFGGWRERKNFFQEKTIYTFPAELENNLLKAGSCTIQAASKLGLLM